ncbi:MAG: GNAT family N-acetyltransferase [Akkermansiaceae bacterium]
MSSTSTTLESKRITASEHKIFSLALKQVTQSEFASLEEEWDDFHAQTQIPSPFQSWDYLDCWWQTYGDHGYDVRMFVARDEAGKLIGAAPLMLTQKGAFLGARGKFRHLAFMGGVGELLGESLELPALRGYEEALGKATAELIIDEFKGQWDVAYFYLASEKSISTNSMRTRLAQLGIDLQTSSSLASPYIDVDGSWDEHLAARPKKFSSRVRYIQSYATRRFAMDYTEVSELTQVETLIDELVRLSSERWGDEAQAFHTTEFVDFHREFAARIFSKGYLSAALVEMNGDVAGAAYNFIYDNKMWGYQVPWDMKFKSGRPGNMLHIWSAKKTFDLGLRELDTLPGEAGYKDEWTNSSHTLNIYEAACPRSIGGTVFKFARGLDRILHHKPQPNKVS